MDAVLQSAAPLPAAPTGTGIDEDPDMVAVLKQAAEPKPSWLASNVGIPLARAGAKAVWTLPGMAMDAGVAARDVIEGKDASGKYPYDLPSQTFNAALDKYLPPPTGTIQKGSELANTMILGAALPAPSGAPDTAVPVTAQTAKETAAAKGAALGMKTTPGQTLDSKALQQVEARAQSVPWLSGPFSAIQRNNQNVLNRTGAAAIGEPGSSVDANVMGAASERLGDLFDKVRDPNSVVMADPKTTSSVLDKVDSDFEGLLPGSGSVRDNSLVKNFENMTSSGAINGEQLGGLSSKLGKAAYKQMTSPMGDRDLGEALYRVKDHADDLLESSLTGADQAEYAAGRQQYRSLMQLARPGVTNPATGDISGATLANRLGSSDRSGYLFGNNQSDLYNATRFAQAFKPIVGDSGTATRSANLKDLALGVPGNMASWLYLKSTPALKAAVNAPKVLTNGAPYRPLSGVATGALSEEEEP